MILDVCCGGKMFYFDKSHPDVITCDIRREIGLKIAENRVVNVDPNVIANFSNLPFKSNVFNLVIFDPPHFNRVGDTSYMAKKYGKLPKDWHDMISKGFEECWRVLKEGGTLIFKWNTDQVSIPAVMSCFSRMPLLGHRTTKNLKTHWIVFYKTEC
jgi:ubiquinone/menaquinone biosynthesis C-methylase UbiE